MPTQHELDETYMGAALLHARLSKAKRLKVGAALITLTGCIIPGVNGLPRALGNNCEDVDQETGEITTKPEVQHAEEAVLHKCSLEGISSRGAKLYVTHSCCRHCAGSMIAAGISEVVYAEEYRDTQGLDLLRRAGVNVRQFKV